MGAYDQANTELTLALKLLEGQDDMTNIKQRIQSVINKCSLNSG